MSRRLHEIEQRKQLLVARANVQRSELNYLAQSVNRPLRVVDEVLAVVRAFRLHPVLSGAAVSSLFVMPNRPLLMWAGRLFTGWELYRVIREQWPRRQR